MHDNPSFTDGDKLKEDKEAYCLRLVIEGKVQGFGYRDWLKRLCLINQVTGWVKNKSNGTVEAVICGNETVINEVFAQCYKGPALAKVTKVKKYPEEVNEIVLHDFKVACSD